MPPPKASSVPGTPLPRSFARPAIGHLFAAVALSILIAGIYGTIAWGMFIDDGNFLAHIAFAKILYNTGHPPVPHFLFHALVSGLVAAHVVTSFVLAGRMVLVGCYVLIGLGAYGLFWIVFRDSRFGRPSILFLAALTSLLAEPITLSRAYALGFLWPEPYQIPTSTLLKPFALVSFACTAWYLFRRRGMDVRVTSLFALATIAGSLSKPSFIICLLPASTLLVIYRLARRLPLSLLGLLTGLYLPAASVLAWQFYVTYSSYAISGMYHDSIQWSPLTFMHLWATGLLAKFLLSITFPVVTTILYWKRARLDSMLQLAWLCFFFGSLYSYMLVEKHHWSDGNFVWSGYITAFILFIAAVVFWTRQVAYAPSGGRLGGRVLLCGGSLVLHAISGVRLDWLYLTHYGCTLNFRIADFVCRG